jgi:hypothetical protein
VSDKTSHAARGLAVPRPVAATIRPAVSNEPTSNDDNHFIFMDAFLKRDNFSFAMAIVAMALSVFSSFG